MSDASVLLLAIAWIKTLLFVLNVSATRMIVGPVKYIRAFALNMMSVKSYSPASMMSVLVARARSWLYEPGGGYGGNGV